MVLPGVIIKKCGKLETFEKCDSQRFQCPKSDSDLTIYDNMPPGGRLINSEVLSPDLMNQIKAKQERESNNVNTLEQQERQRQYQIQADLELLTQKRDITLQNNLERNKITYAPVQKPDLKNLNQFKPNGDLNVYAPIVRKQKADPKRAYNLGKQKALDIKLDLKIQKRIAEYEKQLGLQTQGYNPNPNNNCNLTTVTEPEVYPFQCREQTRNLYKFNKLVKDSPDCLFCEQLFNNQTKRKHLSVGRVPSHILPNQ